MVVSGIILECWCLAGVFGGFLVGSYRFRFVFLWFECFDVCWVWGLVVVRYGFMVWWGLRVWWFWLCCLGCVLGFGFRGRGFELLFCGFGLAFGGWHGLNVM